MNYFIAAMMLFFAQSAAAQSCEELTADKFAQLSSEDKIYFLPDSGITSYEKNGVVFLRDENKCCSLKNGILKSPTITCSEKILLLANRKYETISDFSKFKEKFVSCLKKKNRDCLRPLITRQFQMSFGFEGYGDLREQALAKWKDSDLQKMQKLIEMGIVDEGENRSFPPKPENEGTGWRGGFTKTSDGWQLKYFLAGD